MCYTVKSIDDVRSLVVAARGLSSIAGIGPLTASACRRLHDQFGADLCVVALYDDVLDRLAIGAVEGATHPVAGFELERGPGLAWRALERGMPATTADCAAEVDHSDEVVEAFASNGAKGMAAVPIVFGGSWLGVLLAGNRSGRVRPRETTLMSEFAAVLAPLIVTAGRMERAGELAVEEERQRIALRLHDTAGQLLFKIAMGAQELQHLDVARDAELVIKTGHEIEVDAAAAASRLREAMHNLLPVADALPITARSDAASFSTRSGVATEVVTTGTPRRGPGRTDAVLLGVIREALHNIEKHADAFAAVVSIGYHPGHIEVVIDDDGVGLPLDFACDPIPGRRDGLGLPGVLQQIQELGGVLELTTNDDGGTSLRLSVPAGGWRS